MTFTQQVTKANGRTVTVIAKTAAQLTAQVAVAAADISPVYPDINNPTDANKFVTRYTAFPNKVK